MTHLAFGGLPGNIHRVWVVVVAALVVIDFRLASRSSTCEFTCFPLHASLQVTTSRHTSTDLHDVSCLESHRPIVQKEPRAALKMKRKWFPHDWLAFSG